ncbi:peptide chain release factor 2 [Candidatus Saccharibacteria bacterium CG_4_10_14_0_2_um_filter_52_9]|nr:MAG: peptide chain release factor 2 [Candidatus Saccharibacteria bacterium CG_4_10_14_0_2_um_filter_52_9]
MDDLAKQSVNLQQQINKAVERLKINELSTQLAGLQTTSQASGFWDDSAKAQDVMKQIARLEARIKPWQKLQKAGNDIAELTALKDSTMQAELTQQLTETEAGFNELKEELKFNGPYDDHAAILTLSAGAGGTDAQDWTQMLFRMYVRWAEASGYKVINIDESAGEEAGLKSATIEIDGAFAYGKLKGEHGVHRLVRLSPFNSDNLRQTSFAKVEVMPKIDRPDDLDIDEKDLKTDVYRSGGKGGQSVNTTDSAVRVMHIPTGITVAIQNERSQLQNKETAMTILRSKLAQLQLEQHKEQLGELKGPNQSAEWGNQIRSYVLHPYKQVKDLRTKYETSDPDAVLDGNLNPLIDAFLEYSLHA